MDSLVERLGRWSRFGYGVEASATMKEAAARITALEADSARLREALVMAIAEMMRAAGRLDIIANCNEDRRLRAALSGTSDYARQALADMEQADVE